MLLISKNTRKMFNQYKEALKKDVENGVMKYFKYLNKINNINVVKVTFDFEWRNYEDYGQYPHLYDVTLTNYDKDSGFHIVTPAKFQSLKTVFSGYKSVFDEIFEELFDIHEVAYMDHLKELRYTINK